MEALSNFFSIFLDLPANWHHYIGQHFANDPRVKDWPLMGGAHVPIVLMVGYVAMIVYGPGYMESRKPVDLKPIMRIYNFTQVVVSAYIFSEFATLLAFGPYALKCSAVDRSEKPHAMRMARAVWLFMLSKMIDLLDTVFLILRKKYSQISFLHVYHHCSMVANFWGAAYMAPGGHTYIIGLFNSLVHVVMYTYYYMASLGPRFQKYLWWKRYLTQLQLAQFFTMMFLTCEGLYNQCNFPPVFLWWVMAYLTSLVILFSNFYIQEYIKRRRGEGFVTYVKTIMDNGGSMRTLCIQKVDESNSHSAAPTVAPSNGTIITNGAGAHQAINGCKKVN
ncbi:unnamed protein product [Notodromas monacha]|uniref:Elongation of very long chain fatty acids protein n=1 Tax=Notodromas monacha TaxID=399045 RepID=A0A7R9GC25_9CRUS|nr:unnamed protein product [Notodromas monacha]CAG0915562.1 unnamed protein product [Notodromas monacha]